MPSASEDLLGFDISNNPASETLQNQKYNKSGKNPLEQDEMAVYWKLIETGTDFKCALLRLHLLCGAPRIDQIVRLLADQIYDDRVVIFDLKGRPGAEPRRHTLVLIDGAKEALKICGKSSPFAISTNSGKTHVAGETLSQWACEIARPTIPTFQTKQLRSGVETLLARLGVSKETRGRIQSHGISGVQDRHYNDYDYFDEIKDALEKMHRFLRTKKQQVA